MTSFHLFRIIHKKIIKGNLHHLSARNDVIVLTTCSISEQRSAVIHEETMIRLHTSKDQLPNPILKCSGPVSVVSACVCVWVETGSISERHSVAQVRFSYWSGPSSQDQQLQVACPSRWCHVSTHTFTSTHCNAINHFMFSLISELMTNKNNLNVSNSESFH